MFWEQVKTNLNGKNSKNQLLKHWFEPTSILSIENRQHTKCFRIGVPTDLHKFWITQNLLDRICSEISAIYNNPFEVEFVVTGEPYESHLDTGDHQPDLFESAAKKIQQNHRVMAPSPITANLKPSDNQQNRDVLNPDYTFSTFVVGRNNEFAHAASYSIAENPGTENYNPLFICGPTGMGKTHLLNAVGNQIRAAQPQLRIMYVSAERFLNECIQSIRRHEMDKFRKQYRDRCEILLMDDIQILGRGEAVQEEFFHTLNDFLEKGRQVVVASDRMPKDIKGLEDRIRTRLEWGLIADIQMPDIETRVAILRYKAERKALRLSHDIINYIARISKRSIRELEGNLNKVKMFSELQGLDINLDLVKRVLATHDDTSTITADEIQKLCAQHFNVRVPDLRSKGRTKPLVVARQVAMYLVKKHLDKSLVDIGRTFGGRDHTTVMNALRRVEFLQAKDADLKRDIEDIELRIHNITGL
ncbi:MAG: chromosomal replication initiator protein DnaA [Bdellovibrionaceae bacterium]|nr:chromosomal replication initiator protein DnaA [Pseudobdellovibrionaceae bacterium]|tara:strand:- start:126889 stop:128310 length:1422 start_codon:yes stop_codon:yes gene_type:complete